MKGNQIRKTLILIFLRKRYSIFFFVEENVWLELNLNWGVLQSFASQFWTTQFTFFSKIPEHRFEGSAKPQNVNKNPALYSGLEGNREAGVGGVVSAKATTPWS